jgi:hypothetical protein
MLAIICNANENMTTSSTGQHSTASGQESSGSPDQVKRPIWAIVAEIGVQIPDEEWAKVPSDASTNYKHYLYGSPVCKSVRRSSS